MSGFNQVTLLGNITRDIEERKTGSGMAVCNIGLAVNEKRKNGEEVLFIDCTAFDKTAEIAAQYLSKGRQVLLSGRLKLDQWNDKNTGEKKSKIGMIVDKLTFIGGKDDSRVEGAQPAPAPQATASQAGLVSDPNPAPSGDDLPF